MKPKVLFVDDDEFIRKIYLDRLNASDLDVTVASSGKEARTKFEEGGFDIVCLDQVLPDDTGLEILKWIRNENGSKTPVIIFSASGQESLTKEFMDAGATEYIQKDHVVPSEFIDRVKSIIEVNKNHA